MYKHQVSSNICQCILSSIIVNLVLLALALQPTSVLLLPFLSSPFISSHVSFIFHHFRSCSLMSFCLVNGYQVDPVSFQSSSSQAHPASIARRSLGCLESYTRQTPVLHFSTHLSPLPATFVPLSLVMSSFYEQPTYSG